MPLAAPTTAEQVMAAIEAVVANGATAEADMVAAFLDSTPVRATAALDMALRARAVRPCLGCGAA